MVTELHVSCLRIMRYHAILNALTIFEATESSLVLTT
jgi:hypothetical protein